MIMQCLGAICGVGVVKGFQLHNYQMNNGGANFVAPGYTKGDDLGAEIIGTFVLVYTVFYATDAKRNARDSHVPNMYEKNQYYKSHHDYFSDTFNLKRGGQRISTVLMYLSDNVEGGETYFPMAGTGECSCGGNMVKGLSVKPNKGDAVLFWSMGLDGKEDPSSIHGGCEVLSGEKWSAKKMDEAKTTN